MKISRRKACFILALALVTALVGWAALSYTRTVDLGERTVSIVIKPGDSFGSVVDSIVKRGVVPSKIMLAYPARVYGIDRRLTPGKYDFTGRNSCRSVLRKLRDADFVRIKVTVPEGSTIWKAASILAERLEVDSGRVVNLNHDSTLLARLGVPCLEGYLFPETYFFPWGIGIEEAVGEMVAMFHTSTESAWPDSLPLALSRDEIVTVASIVEAETGREGEHRLVASVYFNRLQKGMKLDADPTVIYGLDGLDRPLNRRDLKKNTQYNTYVKKGLPPTPINSPGLRSIRAALAPEVTDYLYFVADDSGGHQFSRTNAEHNRAKRRIRDARSPSN